MSSSTSSNLIILFLAITTAISAWYMTPRNYLADELGSISIKEVVPSKIGDWTALPDRSGYFVNPQQQPLLDLLYNEILERTYVDSNGYRIMLSIAYGRDQSDNLSLHEPKVCYPAQGFSIKNLRQHELTLGGKTIIASQLVASFDRRVEPVTYWTLVGDEVFVGGLDKKLKQMKYGFNGYIPDGILVRISSIDDDTERAYAMHKVFASNMIDSLAEEIQVRFIGAENEQ